MMHGRTVLIGVVMLGMGGEAARGDPPPEIPLFNGRDLAGWRHVGGGRCAVEDGCLVLTNDTDRTSGYLVSYRTARDFEAHFVCQVPAGDSGFLFRCRPEPRTPTDILGPQVQLNLAPGKGLGGLFEAQGRGWLVKPPAEVTARIAQGQGWIDGKVTARGPRIVVVMNGVTTVDVTDADPDNRFQGAGGFALQLHGGGELRARFRALTVRILD
jgi:hypothetical protein